MGMDVSPLTLGTVQFGLPYGLKENAVASTQNEVDAALDFAFEHGISSLDTAAVYGDSEEKIGHWLNGRNLVVTTKVHDLDVSSEMTLIMSMREKVDASRKRLRLSCIPIVMVHHFDEYAEHKSWFDKAFEALKAEGKIGAGGVSAYSTNDYYRIALSGLEAVQIPVNIFDWKQIKSGGLNALQESGMIVFARSIYLQGLLLRDTNTLPRRMSYAAPTLRKYIDFCNQLNLSQSEMAMSFVHSLPGITSIVVGCRNLLQVKGNCELFAHVRKFEEAEMEEIRDRFSDTDKKIVVPMLWPKE